jgi:hypothetical protein
MAKIKMGAIVVDARGKIGGHSFQASPNGLRLISNKSGTKKSSVAQQKNRAKFSKNVKDWSLLTAGQRDTFNVQTANYKKSDVFGDLQMPSGKTLFSKLNQNLALSNQALISEAVNPVPLPNVSNMRVSCSTLAQHLRILTDTLTTEHKFIVYATPKLGGAVAYVKDKFKMLDVQAGGVGVPLDVWGKFSALYGVPQIGDNFYLAYKVINPQGQTSILYSQKVLVSEMGIPFIMQVKTDNAGTSLENEFTIPTTGGGYNYFVDWGDGSKSLNVVGGITHTYAVAGTYLVSIVGAFPRIWFNNSGDKLKLLDIKQWGSIKWSQFIAPFNGCSNLVGTFRDNPILSSLNISFVYAFLNCAKYTGGYSSEIWLTQNVFNLQSTFQGCLLFDKNIGNWNVSNCNNFSNFMYGKSFANYSVVNMDALLLGWSSRPVKPNMSIHFGKIRYSAAGKVGLDILRGAPNNWTVVIGTQV